MSGLCRLLGESDFQQTETRGFGSVCSMLETDRYCLTAFSTWTRLGFDRHFSRITKNATEPMSATHSKTEGIIDPVVPFDEAAGAYEQYVDRNPERAVKLGVRF